MVSILLTTYNGSHYIGGAIDSILAQDYEDWELIVIDDASTDSTPIILCEYVQKDGRIKIFRNEKNLKLVESLNRGIKLAQGKYIARLDDDDIWSDSSKLSKQVQLLEHKKEIGIVGTFATTIDEDGNVLGSIIHESSPEGVRRGFGLKNQLIHTSILARKSILVDVGLYCNKWLYVEDFDLWLRVLGNGYEIENIPEKMVEYRVRQGNTTAKKYYSMQWLTFLRLLHDKTIYISPVWKAYCLSIRIVLVILPMWIVKYLK